MGGIETLAGLVGGGILILPAVIVWLIGIVLNGMIAAEKNRSVAGVVVTSIFLSPFTAYLYLLAVPVKSK